MKSKKKKNKKEMNLVFARDYGGSEGRRWFVDVNYPFSVEIEENGTYYTVITSHLYLENKNFELKYYGHDPNIGLYGDQYEEFIKRVEQARNVQKFDEKVTSIINE